MQCSDEVAEFMSGLLRFVYDWIQAPGKADKNKSTTKILVRNVAFELKEKDLRDLFSPYGQIKGLRLPKRFGDHRGYAFIEFLTKQDAQNALRALSGINAGLVVAAILS